MGETGNALHIRLNGHRNDSKAKRVEKPVAEHFNQPGHDLTIMKIRKNGPYLRGRRDIHSQYFGSCQHEPGGMMSPLTINSELGVD